MRVALVTCKQLPEPDPDQEPLLTALAAAGLGSEMAAWDDPTVEWSSFRLCVLRSTWNYHLARSEFLSWLQDTDRVTQVWNPVRMVAWNSHKSYLVELAERGFPTAPTQLLPAGCVASLHETMMRTGWEEVVVKPAVSAASRGAMRVDRDRIAAGETHLARLLRREDVLVQEYLPSVRSTGERGLVWIDGMLSHAIQKRPRFDGEEEHVEGPVAIESDEAELARALLQGPGRGALYARVDLARDVHGQPRLMELELIEPSLHLLQEPESLDRFVGAIARLARNST
jgi:glutathione synthase/RimK-type ligase-like ATP-grasp enzyme